jgi:hypothetical protein
MLTIVYYQLGKASQTTLLAILVLIGLIIAAYPSLMKMYNKQIKDSLAVTDRITETIKDRTETAFPGDLMLPSVFPVKGFKYVGQNQSFVDILEDIRVLRLFDKPKYEDITLLFDTLQKTYIYILGGRYDPIIYIPTFMDIRKSVLEQLYSMTFTLPQKFKHVYGISPQSLMDNNVRKTMAATRMMVEVLKSYAEKTAKSPFIPDIAGLPTPFEKNAHTLP